MYNGVTIDARTQQRFGAPEHNVDPRPRSRALLLYSSSLPPSSSLLVLVADNAMPVHLADYKPSGAGRSSFIQARVAPKKHPLDEAANVGQEVEDTSSPSPKKKMKISETSVLAELAPSLPFSLPPSVLTEHPPSLPSSFLPFPPSLPRSEFAGLGDLHLAAEGLTRLNRCCRRSGILTFRDKITLTQALAQLSVHPSSAGHAVASSLGSRFCFDSSPRSKRPKCSGVTLPAL